MNTEKKYIGSYKVYKVFRTSGRREILKRNLTREEAVKLTGSYPNKKNSMVVFNKQFTADKYYI